MKAIEKYTLKVEFHKDSTYPYVLLGNINLWGSLSISQDGELIIKALPIISDSSITLKAKHLSDHHVVCLAGCSFLW